MGNGKGREARGEEGEKRIPVCIPYCKLNTKLYHYYYQLVNLFGPVFQRQWQVSDRMPHKLACIYRVGQKTGPQTHDYNSVNS